MGAEMDDPNRLALLVDALRGRTREAPEGGAPPLLLVPPLADREPISSVPPSAEPESSPLQWIPASRALGGVPESKVVTTPPAPLGDLDLGPVSRRGSALRRGTTPGDALDVGPSSATFDLPPSSAPPESMPLGLIAESAPLSGVPESRPLRAPDQLAQWTGLQSPAAVRALATRVLRLIFSRRRLGSPSTCAVGCEACILPHLHKTEAFIRRGSPVHLVLPAFPAKSANPRKVLGPLPDMAEVVALTFLQNLCTRIRTFYAPGARLTICSDGRVFSDLVGVDDEAVSAYGRELRVILEQLGADALDVYNLEERFGEAGYDDMRAALTTTFARPIEGIRAQIAAGGQAQTTFNGIARFLFEDAVARDPATSRSQARKLTKERAYHVIQRSDAWSALVERAFPDALRLSIHPQPAHAEKIGIHLVETLDNWLTPWHGAAVKVGGRYVLMKRYHAERLGASLVHGGIRPSHFVAETIDFELLRSPGARGHADAAE
jgi:pyoverdine/dityrosine biosynthesis protein Dit1